MGIRALALICRRLLEHLFADDAVSLHLIAGDIFVLCVRGVGNYFPTMIGPEPPCPYDQVAVITCDTNGACAIGRNGVRAPGLLLRAKRSCIGSRHPALQPPNYGHGYHQSRRLRQIA